MAQNTSVVLDDHFLAFVDRQLTAGRYRSASDVIQAGLHLLEDHERKIEAFRAALIEGEESGSAEDFDIERFLQEKRAGQGQ
ncbi:antitoxin ParD1/3/4 [Stella humosa]|uniref:Antitoxin ParD1/3/4 n=1 Tax=Stella humosa TaxID=94 RepID=A0A3N1MGA1_9PROT|nr:type II toxin-antitoxin system ParD family antitoxin [Stella humosa]ROQ00226.1 antitoxin ParD1/3/4 [Stella humosa]BBK30539.1 antitoxin ParD1 [Stella humosa]